MAAVGASSLHAALFIPKPLITGGDCASGRAETQQLFDITGRREEASARARGIFREAARSSDPLHPSGCGMGGHILEEKHQRCWWMAAAAQVPPLLCKKTPLIPSRLPLGWA